MPDLDLDYGAATDPGRLRELNQDAVWAGAHLFVVADGMGGHAAGEVAAAIALQQLTPLAERSDASSADLVAAIGAANAAILAEVRAHAETAGMGTTVSGAYLGTFGGLPHWFVFNVGDSRVYRYVEGTLSQITVDHSEVGELLESGRITVAQAREHPRRNVITRSLGTDPAPVPDIRMLPAVAGDVLLICSDGLTGELPDTQLRAAIDTDEPAQVLADLLCDQAVAAGGRDNVSVIVVRLHERLTTEVDVATAPRSELTGQN